MDNMDELLREKLSDSEYNIPVSFERKFDETIKEIENGKNRKGSKCISWLAANKVASAVILVLMLSVISVSSHAAVNMFQARMGEMSEKVKENYNKDVQNSDVEADAYSRELTDSEEEQIVNLRKQYEREGKFPQNEIKQVESNQGVTENELYFVAKESKFYLPERTLTEEEMLEMIDLQEKRDYSVRQKNIENNKSDKKVSQPDVKLEKQAIVLVSKLYRLAESDLEVVSTDMEALCYEVGIKGGDTQFSVYYTKENAVERVICTKDNLPAHESDVSIKSLKTKKISEKMKRCVNVFTGKEMDTQESYSLIGDNEKLAYGTVSYYYRMSDGSGCVAVYSKAYHDLYDIYILDDGEAIKQVIREKVKKAKGNGYTYRQMK